MAGLKMNEQQQEMMIKVCSGLLMVAVFYGVIINPSFSEIALLKKKIQDTQKHVELLGVVDGLEKELSTSEKSLGSLNDRSLVLGRVSEIAHKNRLEIQSMTPRTQPADHYVRLRIDVDSQGTFRSLLRFLQAIEKDGFVFVTRDFSLTQQNTQVPKGRPVILQIHFALEVYLKQKTENN